MSEYSKRIFTSKDVTLFPHEEAYYGKLCQNAKNYFAHREIHLMIILVVGLVNLIETIIDKPNYGPESAFSAIIISRITIKVVQLLVVAILIIKHDLKHIYELTVLTTIVFALPLILLLVPYVTYKSIADGWGDGWGVYKWVNTDTLIMFLAINIFRNAAYDCYQRYDDKHPEFLIRILNIIYFPYFILIFAAMLNLVEFIDLLPYTNVEVFRIVVIMAGIMFFIQFILRPYKNCLVVADVIYIMFLIGAAIVINALSSALFEWATKQAVGVTFNGLMITRLARDFIYTWNLDTKCEAPILVAAEANIEMQEAKNNDPLNQQN